jgi:hypothetical protein
MTLKCIAYAIFLIFFIVIYRKLVLRFPPLDLACVDIKEQGKM